MGKTARILVGKVRNAVETVLDFFFPREVLVETLERMNPGELRKNAPPAEVFDPSITSLFRYRNRFVERALWEVKYKKNRRVALLLAKLLHEELLEKLAEVETMEHFIEPLLVPVPASKHRLSEHGYNQCLLLATLVEEIDQRKNLKLVDALEKTRETQTQTSMKHKRERAENIKNSFGVKNAAEIRGRNVILLDDITTTGSTLFEATRALKAAGAKNVIAFTVAH